MCLDEITAIIASIEPAEDETDRLRQYAAVLNEISPPPELADQDCPAAAERLNI